MSAAPAWDDEAPKLIDLLLAEQQELSAVEVFSSFHDSADTASEPANRRYEALIPTGLPDAAAGEQYAFRVDLDTCTGCKACVTACHNMNGLEEGETWRSVGLIESPARAEEALLANEPPVHQQTVTTACHHCEEPACLAGCPVNAYEKDASTGIVHHLDDQCIGCRYCQLMCPYDVPTYSERLGIVRKCDMCRGRLAEGEAPACVQGCPNEAIQIVIAAPQSEAMLLPVVSGSMPDSHWTRPSTQYVRSGEKAGTGSGAEVRSLPTDLHQAVPSEGHLPLAIMLVLTQAAVGMLCLDVLSFLWPDSVAMSSLARSVLVTLATLTGLAGLVASTLHLGRPQGAFRAFLGLRTSWMSREIVVLGGFAGLISAACALAWIEWSSAEGLLTGPLSAAASWRGLVGAAAAGAGLLGVYCSAKIYAVTGRPLWRFDRTALRFGTTAAVLGLAFANLVAIGSGARLLPALMLVAMVGIGWLRERREESLLLTEAGPKESAAFERSRHLLAGALRREEGARRLLLRVTGLLLPVVLCLLVSLGIGTPFQVILAALIALGAGAAELLERSLFFRAEAMPSMPGVG